MTKEERLSLQTKSSNLQLISQILSKGLFPGAALTDLIQANQFIQTEFDAAQSVLKVELDRIEKIVDPLKEEKASLNRSKRK